VFSGIDLLSLAILGAAFARVAARLAIRGAAHWPGACGLGLVCTAGATLVCVSGFRMGLGISPEVELESARPTIATPPVEKTNASARSDGASQRMLTRIGGARERLERQGPCA
jgi:hypothetical protein